MNAETRVESSDRRQFLAAIKAFRCGDFSVRLPKKVGGQDGEIAALSNDIVGLNDQMMREFRRFFRMVGKGGQMLRCGQISAARL